MFICISASGHRSPPCARAAEAYSWGLDKRQPTRVVFSRDGSFPSRFTRQLKRECRPVKLRRHKESPTELAARLEREVWG